MVVVAAENMAPFLLLSFFVSINTHLQTVAASSSVSANHSLTGRHTLVSEGGNFVLGFFQPGNKSSSHNFYVGIWYGKVSQLSPVWVANRETPISDPTSSELRISDDGNLVLLNQFKTQIWSTNTTTPMASNTTVAVILDSGNLVLRDGSDPSKVFWQSFDHPTDTWLPGAMVGLNKETGEYQQVTSWKNSDDPAPGIFTFSIEPNGTDQYILQWNRSEIYWTSGIWNGKIFSQLPELTGANKKLKVVHVSNARVNYFTFFVEDGTLIVRLVLAPSGQIVLLTWMEETEQWLQFCSAPKQQCDVYALCGLFTTCSERDMPFCSCLKGFSEASTRNWDLSDRSSGCVRNTPLQCGEKDRFLAISNVSLPDQFHSLEVGSTGDCEIACLNNCSCTAYSYSSGCSVWYDGLLNLQQSSDGSSGDTLFLKLAASELPNSKPKNVFVAIVAAAAVGVFVAFMVLVVLLWIWRCKRRRRMLTLSKSVEGGLVPFRYRDLQIMTNNFAEKLGGGSFGSVFKGSLPHSIAIAVKKLEGGFIHQGEKQFRSEVSTIGAIQHVNLVRLRGFCSEGREKMLVYDYMPNGSLDKQLFQPSSMILSWRTRYQIALGTARGLAYLHERCRDCIIHCDIKPENILLDESFVPKVADFGLAKLVNRDFSRVLTTLRGTVGYLAPEWIYGTAITTKADVYSYGMMLLEIISGKRNTKQMEEGSVGFFPTLAGRKIVEGEVVSLLDPRLEGDADLEELDRACKLAFWCIQDNEIHRPSMGQIVQILEGVQTVNLPPIPRLLQVLDY